LSRSEAPKAVGREYRTKNSVSVCEKKKGKKNEEIKATWGVSSRTGHNA